MDPFDQLKRKAPPPLKKPNKTNKQKKTYINQNQKHKTNVHKTKTPLIYGMLIEQLWWIFNTIRINCSYCIPYFYNSIRVCVMFLLLILSFALCSAFTKRSSFVQRYYNHNGFTKLSLCSVADCSEFTPTVHREN